MRSDNADRATDTRATGREGAGMNLQGEPVRVGRTVHLEEREVTETGARFYRDLFGAGAGGDVAPSLLFHSEVYAHTPRWYLQNLVGNLHARQEWELYAPLRAGTSLRTRSTIVNRYRKRDRDYVVNEVDYADTEGRLLVRGRTHQSFLSGERPRDGYVVDQTTASAKRSAAKRRPPGEGPGPELEPLELLVDREVCWRFSGPGRNYHTDPDEARKLGFPDIVVQGMLGTCLIEAVLARGLGDGWVAGGRMDVKLTNVLWAGERVRARARLLEEAPEGDAVRRVLQVWVEKDDSDRTVVTVGTASGLVFAG
jgi:acyl dehydratase